MKAVLVFAAAGLGMVLVASPTLAGSAPDGRAIGSPIGALPQKGGQQTVAVDQLPAAVTTAIAKSYPGSTIVSAAKVTRGAQVRYDLSVKTSADAQPISVMATADGMIRAGAKNAPPPAAAPGKAPRKNAAPTPAPQGETVAVNQLPRAVAQAIKEAYPKDSIIDATRIASGSQLFYQLTLSDVSHALPMLVLVSSDGKIQKR